MKTMRYLLILVIVMMVIGNTGCTLSASTPLPSTPTSGSGNPTGAANQNMGLFETLAAQTAVVPATTPGAATVPPTTTEGQQPQQPSNPAVVTQAPTVAPTAQSLTVATIAPPTPGVPATYTLQKGEFPYCIARRFNLNPAELLNLNGLSNGSMTFPGVTLKIPQTGHTFPDGRSLHKHPANYTAASGDTIYTVACYYGDVDPLVIAQVNGLSSPYTLTAGKALQIP